MQVQIDDNKAIIIPEPQQKYRRPVLSELGKLLLGSEWWPRGQLDQIKFDELIWPQIEVIRNRNRKRFSMDETSGDEDSDDDSASQAKKARIPLSPFSDVMTETLNKNLYFLQL